MQAEENVSLRWSRKIPSDSQVRDALGIWSSHLGIQEDFTQGITSVTRRVRYYTLLAWYWENLFPKRVIDQKNYEKIFILTCLAHHNGNDDDPCLANIYNKQSFRGRWNGIKSFNLNFNINGFGRTYYSRQLEVFGCAWTDFLNRPHTSSINAELAGSLFPAPTEFFEKKAFDKNELKNFGTKGFCVCNTESNDKEIDVMSKLLFGFFYNSHGEWELNEDEYNFFRKGSIELDFKGKSSSDVFDPENAEQVREMSLRRRNTLFMCLKIIKETTPPLQEFRRYIWDAIYFGQNRKSHGHIDFEKFEKVRTYWEYLQLNVYYVYALEMLLDIIQEIVANNLQIEKSEVLSVLNWNEINRYLSKRLNGKIGPDSAISDVNDSIKKLNKNAKTSLDEKINESDVYDNISNAESMESQFGETIILLCLLYNRFNSTPKAIRDYNQGNRDEFNIDTLYIQSIFADINESVVSIREYLTKLAGMIVNRHLLESARRLSYGTKNWIFTEEDGRLLFARKDYVFFQPRDNRWQSVRSLLKDLKLLEEKESRILLTRKGREWLDKTR